MKKIITAMGLITSLTVNAQMKVYSNGKIAFGSTSTTPNYMIDVISGDINVSTANGYLLGGNYVLSQKSGALNTLYVGVGAGSVNIAGYATAVGSYALNSNTTGSANAALGTSALYANTTGGDNTAVGHRALYLNSTASYNTAFGAFASNANTIGNYNTAVGGMALYTASTGTANTAMGYKSLYSTSTGTNNVAFGYQAGLNNTTGSGNTFIGYMANSSAGCATLSNMTAIGNGAVATAANDFALGSAVATIHCAVTTITTSDGRFKTNVTENVKGLQFIKKLRPVTYNLNTEALDQYTTNGMSDSILTSRKQSMDFAPSMAVVHSGFIAQEVEEAAKAVGFTSSIVHHPTNSNDPYGLGYEEIVVPLVKAVQELADKIDNPSAKTQTQDSIIHVIHKQDSLIQVLQKQIATCCTANNSGTNNNTQGTTTGINSTTSNSQNMNAILYQNVPNPFSQTTIVRCFVPQTSQSASLMVFDMNGSLKKTIAITGKGDVNLTLNGNQLVSGMYYYTLLIDGQEIDTKKMILTE